MGIRFQAPQVMSTTEFIALAAVAVSAIALVANFFAQIADLKQIDDFVKEGYRIAATYASIQED